ncbi:SIR2 family protein (plasmid) [Streptomyces sp. NBC_00053]|uniref:SIR2 family protein n=1 Tax=unclassified Streptomyces TaxID=2593676 RepID=UPI00225707A3|nr:MULTISPECIES: SIR2 family protein [unclassified Streptomyces]MCX4399485.1 SIR2 family protein [Streptomyces sp. NBC_01767]MCX5506172.1 SIR2 family protein [Streptomyces sp. NBC_00052]MCX5554125.1 SIR2 family protein [Streptomyces sp. NBC_00051]
MEPYVKLAVTMRSVPGGYAVLLGAGASITAGMPSAWEVQQVLIERLASVEGTTEIGDPHTWYKEKFGHEATYDGLLAQLTSSAYERQALLRSFFEPDDQEREQGHKQPAAAHQAIARLVAAGHVRIVLTTNFDRLMETALRQVGIEPTVVAHPDDVAGLAPLHTLSCLVVHVHGDYLNPTSMLNTPEELSSYDPAVDELLDRIFADYGLVISGWSAAWDPALRNALSRCSRRVFASYWTDPRELSDHARDVLTRRGATYVQTDADTFFPQLADAVDALADTERRHPTSIAIAVASAKRDLSGARQAISLHDSLRREVSRVASLPLRTTGPWKADDLEAEHGRRLGVLEAETELLLALIATTAYWGTEETDRWWIRDIDQLGTRVQASGDTTLINLSRAPATMTIYAAGIAALVAERWHTLTRVLTEPRAEHPFSWKVHAAAALLSPWETVSTHDASKRLHDQLRPVFTEHLALSETAYLDAWERFEYLRLIVQQDDANLDCDTCFIRKTGSLNHYELVPAAWLKQELDHHGDLHPLLKTGFLNGNAQRLHTAKDTVDAEFNRLASEDRWR